MSNKTRRSIMMAVLIGVFMGALDSSIVAPLLTTLMAKFHIRETWGVWVIAVYSLFYAVSQPILGKLSDRYPRRTIFLVGCGIFALGSVLTGMSQNFLQFLMARAIQGIGGGGILPVATAEIDRLFPDKKGAALGLIGALYGVATIIGPNVGAFLIGLGDWRVIFFLNVPVIMGVWMLSDKWPSTHSATKKSPIDLGGGILFLLGMFPIMIGLTEWSTLNNALEIGALVIGGGFLLVIFYRHERKVRDPMLSPNILRQQGMVALLISAIAAGATMASMIFVPVFAQERLHMNVVASGMELTPLAIAAFVISGLGGYLSDRIPPGHILATGFAIFGMGSFLINAWVSSPSQFILTMILMGVGIGLTMGAPLTYLAVTLGPRNEKGVTVAWVGVFRSIGVMMGPILFAHFGGGIRHNASFLIAALLSLLGMLAALTIETMKRSRFPRHI